MREEESAENPTPSGITEPDPQLSWGVRHVIYGWLLGQVAVILVVIAINAFDSGIDLDDPSLEITAILQAALWVGTLGIPMWLYLVKGVSWKEFGWEFQKNDILPGLLIGLGTQIAAGLLYLPLVLIFDGIDVSEPARELVDKATGFGVFLLFLVVAIGAPLVEELFYRGLTLKAFEKKMSNRLALVLSSLVFAIAHLQLIQFPALFLFGFVAGYLARKYDRLGRAVWAHVGFNTTTVVALLLQG
ncbi:MAG: Uncharacterised protein [Acidimicrobiaceae bacterium]|jgi:membrane protease YdiL (CAAX protease family)|nr:MAG: Uncharacterised protein [Acidimicrobiaceae bacterium]|tara:strand:- start:1737 stop:2471 length:735 start_codon:yes stop_codon:yes gene_type:complete